jgi:hypothetical protein
MPSWRATRISASPLRVGMASALQIHPPQKGAETFFAEVNATREPFLRRGKSGSKRGFEPAAGAAVPRAQESAKTEKCAGGVPKDPSPVFSNGNRGTDTSIG